MQPQTWFFDAPNPEGEGSHAIAVHEWGKKENPNVVFCVHGLTRNARDFDFLASDLSRDHRVICPDVAGRGDSAPMPRAEWYTNPQSAADMLALMKHLNIASCQWVGTSMGGIIGMILAATQRGRITRMVLNDIGAEIPKEGLHNIAQYVGVLTEFPDEAAYLAFLKTNFGDFLRGGPQIAEHVARHSATRRADGSYVLRYDPRIGEMYRATSTPEALKENVSLWNLWEAIACPVLLLHGETSGVLLADTARRMTETGPKARLITYPGVGHCPSLMEPHHIATVREWLD